MRPHLCILAAGVLAAFASAGCDPVVNVYGSYFPGWLLALLGGVCAAIAARVLFAATRLERHLGPLILVYPCLVLLFGCGLWLWLFRT